MSCSRRRRRVCERWGVRGRASVRQHRRLVQGFTLSDNGTSCLDVDECVKSGVCVDGLCVNTGGSFHCQCETGFTTNPERTACLDVDECVSSGGSVCGSHRCENTIGSYRCLTSCEPGYQVYQGRCVATTRSIQPR
ncbi:hypothetical protein F2P81_017689 [Scophthalmus maximus]|uniref:EGF-like domain-containing protein n=1 Tax=Scophthalmus maximus TaxID=52904 RepID=A0A6A4SFF3_SCOMX|nr:hypothetical protein F2P81_017689 [Scophthalmus maximus]